MATQAYYGWISAGQPAYSAAPIVDLAHTLHGYGYNVGRLDVPGLGDIAHLTADFPEDHTPYSYTGWPVPNPYPWVHAIDVMEPVPAGLPSLVRLARQLYDDRQAGVAGVGWLKYMNRSLADGRTVNDSWTPSHTQEPSSDTGHIHLSARTDYTHSTVAAGYDPVARILEADMALDSDPNWQALIWRMEGLIEGRDAVIGGPTSGEKIWPVAQIKGLLTDVAALKATQGQPLTDDQVTRLGAQIADAVVAHHDTLTAEDVPTIQAGVEKGLRDVFGSLAGAIPPPG